jgi:hypothetical protein
MTHHELAGVVLPRCVFASTLDAPTATAKECLVQFLLKSNFWAMSLLSGSRTKRL